MASFLTERKRQPKIYIDLPSRGIFYDENIIQDKQYTEIPVFGMNTMDEIMIKTPDALFSGESTVDVIKSCIPIIKNPWELVGFDIDYILIAIRISTYSELMPITTTCPKCNESLDSDLNLSQMLATVDENNIAYFINFEDLRLDLKPLTYRKQTNFAKQQYVFEREMLQIDRMDKNDDEKNKLRQDVLEKMTKLNAEIVLNYIFHISNTENEREFDFNIIREFITNNDAAIFNQIQDKVKQMNEDWSLPDLTVDCTNTECKNTYTTSITMDFANFFADKSLRSRILKY